MYVELYVKMKQLLHFTILLVWRVFMATCDASMWSLFQWQTHNNSQCTGTFSSVNISQTVVSTFLECVGLCATSDVCSDVFYDDRGALCTLANDVQGCVPRNIRRISKVSQ